MFADRTASAIGIAKSGMPNTEEVMPSNDTAQLVGNEDGLRDIMGPTMDIAIHKSRPKLDKHCKAFIERSPFLCIGTSNADGKADVSPRGDPPGFVMYGGKREHPATPARQGHAIQAALKKNKIWSKMVYIDFMGHVPAKRILFSPKSRDKETHAAYLQFLDMVCHGKGKPKGGDVIKVKRKTTE